MRDDETFEGAEKLIRELATKGFAEHVLTEEGPGEWHCAKPGTGVYSFRVLVRPSAIIVWGDLGEGIFRPWCPEPVGWLRSSVYSTRYLLEKLKRPEQEFYAGDAFQTCREHIEDNEPGPWREKWETVLRRAKHLHSYGELNRHTWGNLVMDHLNDPEYCSVATNYSSGCLWLVECLRWFVEHLPVEAKAEVRELAVAA